MEDLQPLHAVCTGMRDLFERILATSDNAGIAGTCLNASILLQQSLERLTGCETVVRGGDGASDGGARDRHGEWHGHYWVEGVSAAGQPFLADITADQFGWPPVVVMPLEIARERYIPGDDTLCGIAVDAEIERMVKTLRLG